MPQLLRSLILILAAFLLSASAQTPAIWQPNTPYAIGAKVTYNSAQYTCLQAHTSQSGQEPSSNPALWQSGSTIGVAAPPPPPTTASPASPPSSSSSSSDSCWAPWNAASIYTGGAMVSYQGKNWRAAWWTQGEDPATHTGVAQPWVLISACDTATTRTSTAAPRTAAPTTAPNVAPTAAPSPSNGSLPKRVVGYFVEWGIYAAHNKYYVTSIPFNKLTHINYAFVGINPSTLAVEIYDPWATTDIVYPGEPWDTTFKGNLGQLRKAKLSNPNLKVLISVGGWTKSHGFHAAAATASSRAMAAANLVAFMKSYGLDGVDIDWEYPGVNRPADPSDPYDNGAPGGPEDRANYTLFMAAIRAELDRVGSVDGKNYELTAAVGVGYDKIALTDPGQYIQYMDAINLMAYDMHGAFESNIGHQAPLYTNPYDTHEAQVKEKYTIDWAVNEFLRLGVPAGKIVLGLPFYSRGWDNVSGGWDADGDGTPDGMFGTGGGTLAGQWGVGGQGPYFTVKALEGTAGWEKFRDPYSKVPWLYNRSLKQLYTYDDGISIGTKLDYANSKGLGGAMYWELDGDAWQSGYDLVNIVAAKILTPTVPDT